MAAAQEEVQPIDHRGGEPVEGILRRRRVSSGTAHLYTQWAARVIKNQRLPRRPTAERVDRGLDRELVLLFLSKQPAENASHMYFAVRWWYTLTNAMLRLSYASLKGYLKARRSPPNDPLA